MPLRLAAVRQAADRASWFVVVPLPHRLPELPEEQQAFVLPLALRFLQGPVWSLAALSERSLDFASCLELALVQRSNRWFPPLMG
ncbi:hypothetical protein D3C80_1273660 [compost metagenome]